MPVYVPTNISKASTPITDRLQVSSVKPAPPQEASVTGSESAPENNNTREEGTLLNHICAMVILKNLH